MAKESQVRDRKVPPSAARTNCRPPGGSRKGKPNKATVNAREAIARFVDGNVERLEGWLDEIAEQEGALAAFRCVTEVLEYHVPKLSRADVHATGSMTFLVDTGISRAKR